MEASRTDTTEITITSGARHLVHGAAREIEKAILDASRGSLMQFAWFADAESGADLAVNPACVAMLRDAGAAG